MVAHEQRRSPSRTRSRAMPAPSGSAANRAWPASVQHRWPRPL